jgi:HD superfamily phosphohydrolase
MDYLRRDSFFTGVTEGIIGSDRIIKMLNVYKDELVVEAKGIYSIEKFLLARRLMYWQVYLHKTVISADQLLLNILRRARILIRSGEVLFGTPALLYFLRDFNPDNLTYQSLTVITHFAMLDDTDIVAALKMWVAHIDPVLASLSTRLLNRTLYHIEIQNEPFTAEYIESIQKAVALRYNCKLENTSYFVSSGILSNNAYSSDAGENILVMQHEKPVDIAEASDLGSLFGKSKVVEKYFIYYPKELK